MTDNEKPVFFSTHLHDDLEHAFDDLRRIHGEIAAVIRTDDLEKWTTTYEDAVNEKLKGNHLVYERDTYQTLVRILQWDRVDVRQLARWIRELKELTSHIGLDVPYLLHVKQIPTEPIPEDVEKYPVFVLDRQGYCLCGMDLAEIRYIDEVRDLMEEK